VRDEHRDARAVLAVEKHLLRLVVHRLKFHARLAEDAYTGATITGGQVTLPTGPGLGVAKRKYASGGLARLAI
jgi:hypothetical protein